MTSVYQTRYGTLVVILERSRYGICLCREVETERRFLYPEKALKFTGFRPDSPGESIES